MIEPQKTTDDTHHVMAAVTVVNPKAIFADIAFWIRSGPDPARRMREQSRLRPCMPPFHKDVK